MEAATTHPNAGRMFETIRRFNAGDFSGVAEMFTEDAVWHAAGSDKHAGDHRGEAIGAWFKAMGEKDCRVEPVDIMADDEHVAFVLRVIGDGLDQIHVNAWRMVDGRASEGWFLPDDVQAWNDWVDR